MAGENTIQVVCSCGKKLKAPATSAGRKGRCPACGNTIVLAAAEPVRQEVVAAAARAAEDAASNDAGEDDLGGLYELAKQADAAPQAAEVSRCPQCGSGMDEGAVLCTNCGYDTRTGKSISKAAVAKPMKSSSVAAVGKGAKKPVDYMAPDGSFLAGLAVSAALAVAASVLWFVCVWVTGYSVGYIAILIGGAAGVGMQVGHKGYSRAGGFAAAGMTLGAILLAKVAVVEFILLPIASHHDPHASIFNLSAAGLAYYFFRPVSLLIIAIGMGAAFRTANGSVTG